MRSAVPMLFAVMVSLGAFQNGFACVCNFEKHKLSDAEIKAAIVKEFNESASVFSGEVIAQDVLTVKFKVITAWKGEGLEEFTMSTGTVKVSEDLYRSSSCDYTFKVGEKYLVYARWAENNQLVARACTRTRVLSNDVPDFQELDILNPGAYHAPSPTSLSRWLDTTLPRYAYAADFEELTLQQHYRIVSLPARARRGA